MRGGAGKCKGPESPESERLRFKFSSLIYQQLVTSPLRASVFILKVEVGTSLVVQSLKPLAPNAGRAGTIPHVPTKSLHAPTKDPTCCNGHKDQVRANQFKKIFKVGLHW